MLEPQYPQAPGEPGCDLINHVHFRLTQRQVDSTKGSLLPLCCCSKQVISELREEGRGPPGEGGGGDPHQRLQEQPQVEALGTVVVEVHRSHRHGDRTRHSVHGQRVRQKHWRSPALKATSQA